MDRNIEFELKCLGAYYQKLRKRHKISRFKLSLFSSLHRQTIDAIEKGENYNIRSLLIYKNALKSLKK